MKILICSDGMPASENAIDLAALLAGPLKAEITLLGIVEKSSDEQPLREALEREAQSLRTQNAATGYCRARGRTGTPDSRSNIKHRATISFLLARAGLEQAGTIGAPKEHTKSSKRYSRQCWWRSVNAKS